MLLVVGRPGYLLAGSLGQNEVVKRVSLACLILPRDYLVRVEQTVGAGGGVVLGILQVRRLPGCRMPKANGRTRWASRVAGQGLRPVWMSYTEKEF